MQRIPLNLSIKWVRYIFILKGDKTFENMHSVKTFASDLDTDIRSPA